MNTLRVKIAVLMVIVIVSVVFSLTLVLFALLGPPKRIYSLGPVAQQVVLLLHAAEEGSAAVPVAPEPAVGRVHEGFTQKLRDALAARGLNLAVQVSRDGWRAPLMVSVPVGSRGWFYFPITDLPPVGVPGRGCSDGCC